MHRFVIRYAALILGFIVSTAVLRADISYTNRPNILWIIGDDLGPDLGCYGTPAVKTPNIDKLAAEGTRFKNCHTTAPVCSPSRSALMTGMYQTTIGSHDHRSMVPLPTNMDTITYYFRQAHYWTANVKTIAPGLKVPGKTDFNFPVEKPFDGDDFEQLKSKQPFFAEINFTEPHRGGAWKEARREKNLVDPAKVVLPPYYPDHPITRDDYANYLDAVQLLDKKVGLVLKRLEEMGLASNTVVFFFGDNGRCHLRDKQWLYEGGTWIPLIVRWPGNVPDGAVRDDLLSAIDISATSLRLAGVILFGNLQGKVFLGPETDPRQYLFTARDRCDETVDRIRAVRDREWKYIRNFHPELPYTQPNQYKETQYPVLNLMKELFTAGKLTPEQAQFMVSRKPDEELYNLAEDPHEIHNLAIYLRHRPKLAEMRQVLDNWIKETKDQGENPPGPVRK
jgi:arylsulfatase A-like enzyme